MVWRGDFCKVDYLMPYAANGLTITAFWTLVVLGLAATFWRTRKQRPAPAEPQHWLARGLALGTHGISGAILLGVCGLIAFYGYDGLLYAIGLLAGWFVALLGIAGPLGHMSAGGTLAQAVRVRLNAPRAAKAVALASLLVCLLLLTAELSAAGALLRPLLGDHTSAATASRLWVALAGAIALLIACFWNGGLRASRSGGSFVTGAVLLLVCGALAWNWLQRPLQPTGDLPRVLSTAEFRAQLAPGDDVLPNTGPWADAFYARVRHVDGSLTYWRYYGMARLQLYWAAGRFVQCQVVTQTPDGRCLVNGLPAANHDLPPAGWLIHLPEGVSSGPAPGPLAYLATVQESDLSLPRQETIIDATGRHQILCPVQLSGEGLLLPGQMPGLLPDFPAPRSRINLLSLMLALFAGGAALAAIFPLERQSSASAAVGIGVVSILFLLLLWIALGALVAGRLDPSDANRTLPLAADNPWMQLLLDLALLALIADTMRRLLRAIVQALVDLTLPPDRAAAPAAPAGPASLAATALLAAAALAAALWARQLNAAFVVGWALNLAAATLLPAILALLFTRNARGITPAVGVGLVGSFVWMLLSSDALEHLFGYPSHAAANAAIVPWNQPALLFVPLSCLTLLIARLTSPSDP